MTRVEVALGPVGLGIIEVLVVRVGRRCLSSPIAIVAAVIGPASGEGIRYLILQTVRVALLQHGLKSMIVRAASRRCARYLRDIGLERWISREENARAS